MDVGLVTKEILRVSAIASLLTVIKDLFKLSSAVINGSNVPAICNLISLLNSCTVTAKRWLRLRVNVASESPNSLVSFIASSNISLNCLIATSPSVKVTCAANNSLKNAAN